LPPLMDEFYVVRPTPALCEWLKAREVPEWMQLDRPQLWSQLEVPGDHDYVGQAEDARTFLKLAVLASFQRRLDSAMRPSSKDMEDYDAATRRVLTALLGPPPLTLETFHRWWFLECAEGMHSVEGTIAHTPTPTLRKVRGPHNPSPTGRARFAAGAARVFDSRPRPVGESWDAAVRYREEDAPRLQCALSWLLERLAEKTPHRVCGVRLLPFSLDAPIEQVLHVPGWTLRGRVHDVLEGVRLTLEEPVWRGEPGWNFRYRIYSGQRQATGSGGAGLELEKDAQGWKVKSGSLGP
jgi:hypothetical protein